MKTKALYIYAGAIVIVLISILLFSQKTSDTLTEKEATENQKMPDDEIHNPHKGMDMPSAENIRPDFMDRYKELKEIYAANPGDTASAREFASMLSQAHKKGQAIEIYLGILKINPERTDILMALAYEYYETKQLDNAEFTTMRILELNSSNTQALYNLGSIAIARGDTSKAMNIWQDLKRDYPASEAAEFAENSLSKLK